MDHIIIMIEEFFVQFLILLNNHIIVLTVCYAIAEATIVKQYGNSMQTIRNDTRDLTWFAINVIATSTSTEIEQFHYDRKNLQDESSYHSQI